ncbi:MAG: histidinol dehydrogenase [Sphingobacteriaceae bacterium]|nr:histidinol dehydrogenase [Sphingobacteriaceae bacterium]
MIEIINNPTKENWEGILKRPAIDLKELESNVSAILNDIRSNGDAAVKRYTMQFDKIALNSFRVSEEEIDSSENEISNELKAAIMQAKTNIEKFHTSQKEEIKFIETMPGVKCWRKSIGIEKVGLYIPGGSAPLFSTVLMLGVPAIIAGCKEIILCTPCNSEGKVNAAILFAAKLCGITTIFKIGGVQAIGAMAYGTQSVPKVYKIFGPGNQFVTCSKQLVNKEGIAIDMPAGPSEVAIIADDSAQPSFIAADLLSQAEHGEDSQVILVSTSQTVIDKTLLELDIQLKQLDRSAIAQKALKNSKAILVNSLEQGMELLNEYAPEHLIIACKNHEELSEKVINAGSVFLGNYSCESAGDYASGTNHTLPTNGYAKAYSGVSLDSFVKKITFQNLSKEGLENIGQTIELMAQAEGLTAHKNAVTIRLKQYGI